jgi:hypothetical protein
MAYITNTTAKPTIVLNLNSYVTAIQPVTTIQLGTTSTLVSKPNINLTLNSFNIALSITTPISLTANLSVGYSINIPTRVDISAAYTQNNTYNANINSKKPILSIVANIPNAFNLEYSLNKPIVSAHMGVLNDYTLHLNIKRPTISALGSLVYTATKQTWAFNTITSAHSRYTNYNFDSYFKVGNKNYGLDANGNICEFGYERDDYLGASDSAIESEIALPVSGFGEQTLKSCSDAILFYRTDGDMEIQFIVDEQESRSDYYIRYDDRSGAHRRRVKIPKGMKGSAWQFKIKNVDGSDFSINSFEVFLRTLQRIY